MRGNSQTKIKEYAIENPSVKCDLWSIDGDHGPNAELDFEGYALLGVFAFHTDNSLKHSLD